MQPFDREVYFDSVRASLFGGRLTQQQVDGQEAILADWEGSYERTYPDLRYPAYCLATTIHETASTMWPIEEYGAPDCGGAAYAQVDPETGNRFYGRGLVQLTWKDNYIKAGEKLDLTGDDDLKWHPERALDPFIAGHILFRGMIEGWFRSSGGQRETLSRYFNDTTDDAYGAREIINGDKKTVPSWSNGVSIGNLIASYHREFLQALQASFKQRPTPEPEPEQQVVTVIAPPGVKVVVQNG